MSSSANGDVGGAVSVSACDQSAGQTWSQTAVGEALTNAAGLCMDAKDSAIADGTPVIAYTCTGQPNQNWTINSDGTITGLGGKCLDLDGKTIAPGTALVLWTCDGSSTQRWSFVG